jgi:hypothetical protein
LDVEIGPTFWLVWLFADEVFLSFLSAFTKRIAEGETFLKEDYNAQKIDLFDCFCTVVKPG